MLRYLANRCANTVDTVIEVFLAQLATAAHRGVYTGIYSSIYCIYEIFIMAALQPPNSYHEYTVGLIVALPLERAALELMLDEEHDEPPDYEQPKSDTNSYTFGRLQRHNVVIACLPFGVYGTASATETALLMISTFPNIRFGLMVGIAAGIPHASGPDIRLGDVVVSKPGAGKGGVVQYDFGEWEPTGFLNKPPDTLLKALAAWQSKNLIGRSNVTEYLQDSVTKLPGDSKVPFLYPGVENDNLFEPSYKHVTSEDCGQCDRNKAISRKQRGSTKPVIHFGLIASGNTLVKDPDFRDGISKKLGQEYLCLEMEAAGLMNYLPCLVIRGICGKHIPFNLSIFYH
jgi:nucleoside phosphorylase